MDSAEARRNFIDTAEMAKPFLWKILDAYENLSHEENDQTSKNYPFGSSFDEWLFEYARWISELEETWFPQPKSFKPTLTVGELKKILDGYSDDRQIVLAKDGWYQNIEALEFPDDYQTWTLTLHLGSEFDSFQLGR